MRCKIIDNRKEGQQRVISKYLLVPKRIGNERRWLERATIKQTLYRMFDVTCGAEWWEWRDTEWVDTELIENAIGMKIKFNESHSFAGELMTMSVNGHQHLLEMNKNQTYEQHAVKLLKDIYNVDFNVEDVKFEWDGSL